MPQAWRSRATITALAVLAGAGTVHSQTLRPRLPTLSAQGLGLPQGGVVVEALSRDTGVPMAREGDHALTAEQVDSIEASLASAIEFGESDPTGFLKALRWQLDYPELAAEAVRKGSPIAMNAGSAGSALNKRLFDDILGRVPKEEPLRRKRLELQAKHLRDLVENLLPENRIISLYADASVRGALESDTGNARAGTGAIGIALQKGEASIAFSAVVASSLDTVKSNPGPIILSPATGKGRLSSFQLDVRSPHFPARHRGRPIRLPGLHTYLTGSNSTWTALNTQGTRITSNATVIGLGGLAYYDIIRTRLLHTDVSMSAELGYSFRWLKGNAGVDDSLRLAALGTTEKSFSGPELGFQVTAGAVVAGVQYYIYGDHGGDARVADLTNGQLIIGVGITGNVLRGPESIAKSE
jgi:hypothetical protein